MCQTSFSLVEAVMQLCRNLIFILHANYGTALWMKQLLKLLNDPPVELAEQLLLVIDISIHGNVVQFPNSYSTRIL